MLFDASPGPCPASKPALALTTRRMPPRGSPRVVDDVPLAIAALSSLQAATAKQDNPSECEVVLNVVAGTSHQVAT